MTARSPRKKVDADYWQGRLRAAHEFHRAARDTALLADPGLGGNPVISQAVLAAIAYADCITARTAHVVNQQSHASAPRLLRNVLSQSLPDAQERRFRRILAAKDEAQYGARSTSLQEALRLLAEVELFGQWAEGML